MLFNSLTFCVFFLVVLLLHRLPLSWSIRKLNLLIASCLFYAAWSPPFVVLVWISALTDWSIARRLAMSQTTSGRRALLLTSLCVNLGLLGYFKYGGFLLENFVWLVRQFGIEYQPATPNIILPLGISFYTFQTLAYTISVYRRESEPSCSFLDYVLFLTFFPRLVAGPIVRSGFFLPQCVEPKQADGRQLSWGLLLLTLGLFQKVVLADSLLAPVADLVFGAPEKAGFLDAWIGAFAFSGQIFFDFAGYSSCAIGAALCLGFALPENFRFPYAASGFSDFWRRWHISLSTWLRDYLYISLGGNRRGARRTLVNLMLTMLIGGLWHGASWRFVLWGGLHGAYLVIERTLRRVFPASPSPRSGLGLLSGSLFTFAVVSATWVFFRARDMSGALRLVATMLGGGAGHIVEPFAGATVAVVLSVTFVVQLLLRDSDLEEFVYGLPLWVRSAGLATILVCLYLVPGDDRAFIYFGF